MKQYKSKYSGEILFAIPMSLSEFTDSYITDVQLKQSRPSPSQSSHGYALFNSSDKKTIQKWEIGAKFEDEFKLVESAKAGIYKSVASGLFFEAVPMQLTEYIDVTNCPVSPIYACTRPSNSQGYHVIEVEVDVDVDVDGTAWMPEDEFNQAFVFVEELNQGSEYVPCDEACDELIDPFITDAMTNVLDRNAKTPEQHDREMRLATTLSPVINQITDLYDALFAEIGLLELPTNKGKNKAIESLKVSQVQLIRSTL